MACLPVGLGAHNRGKAAAGIATTGPGPNIGKSNKVEERLAAVRPQQEVADPPDLVAKLGTVPIRDAAFAAAAL